MPSSVLVLTQVHPSLRGEGEKDMKDITFIVGVLVICGIIWALVWPETQCVGHLFCY